MNEKKCPNCGLWNPPSAMRCDCGYDFDAKDIKGSFADPQSVAAARDRAEKNLPTIVIRGIVFVVVFMGANFAMYFLLGAQPRGVAVGVAFGLAGAAAALVKIRVRKWF